jgi:general secretion pathway protein D
MNAKRLSCGVLSGWLLTSALAHAQTGQLGHAVQLTTAVVSQAPTPGDRREADELLRRARTAMKDGDLTQARWYLDRLEKMDVPNDGILKRFSDTPEKLRRDLEKLDPTLAGSPASSGSGVSGQGAPVAAAPSSLSPAGLPSGVNDQARQLTGPNGQVIQNPYAGESPPGAGGPTDWATAKTQTLQLLASGQAALNRGDLQRAEQMAQQARSLGVPDEVFGAGEMRPWMLLLQIDQAKRQQVAIAAAQPAGGGVQRAAVAPYDSTNAGRVSLASAEAPLDGEVTDTQMAQFEEESPFVDDVTPGPARIPELDAVATDPLTTSEHGESDAYRLMRDGEAAVKARDFAKARERFTEAWKFEQELDPVARQRLQDNLQLLRVPAKSDEEPVATPDMSVAEQAAVRRFTTEISREQIAISRQLTKFPKQSWEDLTKLRDRVADAEIPDVAKRQLMARVDRSIAEAEDFIEQNRAKIELDDRNRGVLAEMERRRQHRVDMDTQLAKMVDEFNTLMQQERFSEAVVLAKKARELAPDNVTTESMMWKSRFAERMMVEMSMRERSQMGVEGALSSVIESGIPFNDQVPVEFPSARTWDVLTKSRLDRLREGSRQRTQAELEIEQALKKPVQVNFVEQPLSEVLAQLGNLTGISVYLDPQGLAAEGTTSNMPVTIQLNQEVQLKSALKLILEQFGLTYLIQDEVLKITSPTIRQSELYPFTYNVADLVIPIPNFVPDYNMGLPSAIREAYNAQGFGISAQGAFGQVPLTTLAGNQQNGNISGQTFAQIAASEMMSGSGSRPQPLGFGPGGLGGGSQADFDTLIDLITSTIAPTTWDDVGGEGSIQGFPTNLSLVVSQTREVHEQIADLLEQLRRLQDLQVTIEVRFITLNDNFFERIGVDFDFDIDDNVTALPGDDEGPSVTIGLTPQGNPTADLDLSFTQGSFGEAIPAFGGFNSASAANFGFAILSDIEAFFVIEAAQGDTRTNVLQAPKVTLFNGQLASVNDTTQRPFVTSVTPVVGDFAAAQAPIIVVLNEGTQLNVQAVVSNDRRFVRLTLVPFFSRIGDVEEFTFEGRRSSNTGTAAPDPADDTQTVNNDAEEFIEGTTVQLPQFAFTSVSTTVSVPDGGTILLGGIKRLSEGRNERGVPLLSKFPYINRLFRNVGIGRQTQSLMMMVTPRIIIQEEEEEKLGIATTGN